MADKYKDQPTVLEMKQGTVKAWHPILTEEERAGRMKTMTKACSDLMKAAIDAGTHMAV